MPRYRNLDGNSGVTRYELGADWIQVWFVNGEDYRYSAANVGMEHVLNMHALARAGKGLAGYISKHVHDDYDREA
ncbi:hypothetical protein [Fulvimonas yonginensis]|uniref:KTSC domain-containing protein n=1 Tax=Fulvimonas yonginensis TaxID=1495200 RepID=A0ABU8JBA9_9GAMM